MKSDWQLKREAAEKTERIIRLIVCAVIVTAVLVLQSIAPALPANLEELAVSPSAIGRLQEARR